ncbi:MAG: hypothetical protein ACE15D_19000 [Candidatus Eisenbacteria bacterium]
MWNDSVLPCVLALVLLAITATVAPGADVPVVDYAVPDAPAFTFLGVSPTAASQPGSPRDMAVTLLNAVGEHGEIQQGFALDVTPSTLLPALNVDLDRYQKSWSAYVLATTQLSVGTARASGDSASTDLAVGIRVNLVDEGDPMRDPGFTAALAKAFADCRPALPGERSSQSCLDEKSEELRAAWFEEHWNARRLSLGLAGGARAERSEIDRTEWLGTSIWLVGSQPLMKYGQFRAQVQFDQRQAQAAQPREGVLRYAGQARIGSGSTNAFLELVGIEHLEKGAPADASSGKWSAGLEFRASEGLWISTGFGSRFATAEEPDRVLVIAQVRWGLSHSSRLDSI